MEMQNGFIVGIYNYCDRWCERCAFTSYCRVFAHVAETEASLDPALKPIFEVPPSTEDVTPPPAWLQERIAEANEAASEPMSAEEWKRIRPRVQPEHQSIVARAEDYSARAYAWLKARGFLSVGAPDDPRAVVGWFHTFIPAKINRALTVFPDDDPDDSCVSSDNDGSAKVALIGIEQSHAAWLHLVERGELSGADAQPFIADLVWLGDALERVRPEARAFVRPAFDEPDDVAKLLAAEGRR